MTYSCNFQLPKYVIVTKEYVSAFNEIAQYNSVELKIADDNLNVVISGRQEDRDNAYAEIKKFIHEKNFQNALDIIELVDGSDLQEYLEVDPRCISLIIGTKGQTVRRIQKENGMKIRVGSDGQVGIFGSEESIEKAYATIQQLCGGYKFSKKPTFEHFSPKSYVEEHSINETLNSSCCSSHVKRRSTEVSSPVASSVDDSRQALEDSLWMYINEGENQESCYESEDNTVKLVVPQSVVSRLIGKHGSTVKRFKEEFDCKINIDTDHAVNGHVSVYFYDNSVNVLKQARNRVQSFVDEIRDGYANNNNKYTYIGYRNVDSWNETPNKYRWVNPSGSMNQPQNRHCPSLPYRLGIIYNMFDRRSENSKRRKGGWDRDVVFKGFSERTEDSDDTSDTLDFS